MKMVSRWLSIGVLSLLFCGVASAQFPEADINGYINLYEKPVIESGDTCRSSGAGYNSGVYVCHTLEACDVTYDTTDDLGTDIVWSNGTICIETGDYTGDGVITTDDAGTSGDWKELRCVTSLGARAVRPVDDTPNADRCILRGLMIGPNDDYWVIDRFTLRTISSVNEPAFENDATADFITINEVHADCGDLNTARDACIDLTGVDDIVLQKSLCDGVERNEGDDQFCVGVASGSSDRAWIVANELFDSTHEIQFQNVSEHRDIVVENNDIYRSTAVRQDCNSGNWPGNQNDSGDCQCGEGLLIFKEAGDDTGDRAIVINNRFWGQRSQGRGPNGTSRDCGGSGSTAAPVVSFSQSASYVEFRNNIIDDSSQGVRFLMNDCSGETCGQNSIVANLFHGQVRGDTGQSANYIHFSTGDFDDNLIAFNTFVDGEDVSGVNYMEQDGDNEVACNYIYDGREVNGTWDSGSGVQGDNIYGGDTEPPAGTGNVSGVNDTAAYSYYRRLITGPELVTVTNALFNPALDTTSCDTRTLTSGYGAE